MTVPSLSSTRPWPRQARRRARTVDLLPALGAGLWWLGIDFGPFSDFVSTAPDDRVAILQGAEHFNQVANTRAPAHVHPSRRAVVDADDKCSLGRRDDGGWWNQQGWLRPADWPLHFRIHPCGKPQVGIPHIQFHGHRPGLLVK